MSGGVLVLEGDDVSRDGGRRTVELLPIPRHREHVVSFASQFLTQFNSHVTSG